MAPTAPDVTGLPSPLILTPTELFTVLGLPAEPNNPTPYDSLEPLPNDALGRVKDYLSCSDALNFIAVSSAFLHQVALGPLRFLLTHLIGIFREITMKRSTKRKGSPSGKPRKPHSEFLTETNYELARVPFDSSKFTLGVAPHDQAQKDDILEVSNYATDIFQQLYFAEEQGRPRLYMADQEEITPAMRATLVNCLVKVHMKFRLAPETLYLCINIIDRYCSSTSVKRRKLRLLGVTALLIACKYEEIYPPESDPPEPYLSEISDFVNITGRMYTRQEVLDMEQDILCHLEYKLTVPTAYPFLIRFLLVTKASKQTETAAKDYLERSLQEYQFLNYRPSLVAASAVYFALNNPDNSLEEGRGGPSSGIPSTLLDYTGFNVDEVKACAADFTTLVDTSFSLTPLVASPAPLVLSTKRLGSEVRRNHSKHRKGRLGNGKENEAFNVTTWIAENEVEDEDEVEEGLPPLEHLSPKKRAQRH